jgi:succinoglycan biosynthesis transport protein ExoP
MPMREQPEKIDAKFIKGFIRRRKKIFIVISSLFFAGSILFALFSPKVYVSTATILIEGQIAGDLLKGISMGFIEERLQIITQQILTRDKLLQISKKLNLLANPEDSRAVDAALDEMRKDIELKTIKSGDIDPRSYNPSQTVAFRLSFSADDPSTAYKVATELSSLYVEKNLQRREQITTQTSAVLKEKLSQLKEQTNVVERRLNDFKRAHAGEFPENMGFNLEQTYRLNTQLDEVNAKIKQLEEIKAGSSGQQLTSKLPVGAALTSDQASNDPLVRLSQLRAQLVSLQSKYSDKHPDVRKTKGEIQRIENQLGVSDEVGRKERELESLRNRYAELKKNSGTDDTEVKRLSEEISVLSRQIDEQKRNQRRAKSNSAEDEMNRQISKRDEIQRKINEYARKSQMSSLVQTEYSKLTQEYENASRQYNDTLGKLTDANITKEIEDTQLGERFIIIEEPQVPHKPQKPNRLKIVLGGLFLALCAGLFASVITENADHSIKSAEQLQKITKLPVLTVLPFVMTDEEKEAVSRKTSIIKSWGDWRRKVSNWARKKKGENGKA